MAPKSRIIIDTDPGVDDILAMLLALSASPEELEVLMISVSFGNVELQSCLRNTVSLFHVLDKELAWRKSSGKDEGFQGMRSNKPIVAVGAEKPLADDILKADHFHGVDGLHGVHDKHPHLSPADTWKALFEEETSSKPTSVDGIDASSFSTHFTPSTKSGHLEMLRILRENPVDTVKIVVLGPLTTVAMAAAEDPEAFLRVQSVNVMGGAIAVEGNITPVAEFNCFADPVAAARVYALTSPTPRSTMPPPIADGSLPDYPAKLSRRLSLNLFPLDITTPHLLSQSFFSGKIKPYEEAGSPLATWVGHFISRTFEKIGSMTGDDSDPGLSLHDPLTIWYILTHDDPGWTSPPELEDIRVETSGQWTRGMHVVDRRLRAKMAEPTAKMSSTEGQAEEPDAEILTLEDVPGDSGGWLSLMRGNRIRRLVGSPGEDTFAEFLMKRIFEGV